MDLCVEPNFFVKVQNLFFASLPLIALFSVYRFISYCRSRFSPT